MGRLCLPLSVAHLLGESEEAAHGVGACGEDEDQGSGADHACVEDAQVNGGALHKHGAKVLYHKVGYCLGHLGGRGKVRMQNKCIAVAERHLAVEVQQCLAVTSSVC